MGIMLGDDDLVEFALAGVEAVETARQEAGEAAFVPFEFDFEAMNDQECWFHFRFYKDDLRRLHAALGLEGVVLRQGTHVYEDSFFCMLVYLKRMAYPSRFGDLCAFMCRYHHLVLEINTALFVPLLRGYADAVSTKVGFEAEIIGFIDGTFRAMCRPVEGQESVYSGYKRAHGISFLGVVFPDGMLGMLHGPHAGRLHDSTIFGESKLEEWLIANIPEPEEEEGDVMRIYGDGAFGRSRHVARGYKGNFLTPEELEWNVVMNTARTCVEWSFKEISRNFGYVSFSIQLKSGLSPIGGRYLQAGVLANCHNCLYQSAQTSQYFDCEPPELEEYLSAPPNLPAGPGDEGDEAP